MHDGGFLRLRIGRVRRIRGVLRVSRRRLGRPSGVNALCRLRLLNSLRLNRPLRRHGKTVHIGGLFIIAGKQAVFALFLMKGKEIGGMLLGILVHIALLRHVDQPVLFLAGRRIDAAVRHGSLGQIQIALGQIESGVLVLQLALFVIEEIGVLQTGLFIALSVVIEGHDAGIPFVRLRGVGQGGLLHVPHDIYGDVLGGPVAAVLVDKDGGHFHLRYIRRLILGCLP